MAENLPLPEPVNIVITSMQMDDLAGTNHIILAANPVLTSDTIYYFPNDGTNGQVLTTNGTGILSWTNSVRASGTAVNSTLPKVGNTSLTLLQPTNLLITNADNDLTIPGTAHLTTTTGFTNTGPIINYTSSPSNANELVDKQYVDTTATGLHVLPACTCVSASNLTATYANGASGVGATLTNTGALAAFSTDGYSPALNARVLVAGQSTTYQNGIYTLTTIGSGAVAWVLTRATNYDQPIEISPGDYVLIQNGTVYSGSTWIQTNTVVSVGVDPIIFILQNPSAGLTAGNGITISTNVISANINTTNLQFTANQINTIQDITTTSSPNFLNLSLDGDLEFTSAKNISSNVSNITMTNPMIANSSFTRASGLYSNIMANVGAYTISKFAQIYADTGVYVGGTVTNAYGIYAELPSFGTSKYAGYFNGATYVNGTLTATNLAGTITTASQPNITSLGSLTTLDMAGSITYQNTVPGAGTSYLINMYAAIMATNNITRTACIYCDLLPNPTSYTMDVVAHIYIDQGIYMGGTVNTGYGIYVETPTFGTTKYAGYFNGTLFATSLAGTITSAAQPNITSLGSLTTLDMAGTITYSSTRSTSVTIANIDMSNTFLATGSFARAAGLYVNNGFNGGLNTVTTFAQIYITAGNYVGGTATTAYGIYADLPSFGTTKYAGYFNGATFINGTLTATNLAGTLTTASQPNITSLGTLTSLTVSGSASPIASFSTSGAWTITSSSTHATNSGINQYAVSITDIYSPNTTPVSLCAGVFINLTNNSSTTITNLSNLYISNGTNTAGTVTNSYGVYCLKPSYGTNKYTAYFEGTVGIGTAAPSTTSLLYLSGSTSYVNHIFLTGTMQTSGAGSNIGAVYINPTLQTATSPNNAFGISLTPTYANNGANFSFIYNLYSSITGTSVATTAYAGYFLAPTAGSSVNIALYASNMSIGYVVTPPTNGLIVSGKTSFGSSSIAAGVLYQLAGTLSTSSTLISAADYVCTYIAPTIQVSGSNPWGYSILINPTIDTTSTATSTIYGIFINLPNITGGNIVSKYAALYVYTDNIGSSIYAAQLIGNVSIGSALLNVALEVSAGINSKNNMGLYIDGTLSSSNNTFYGLNNSVSFDSPTTNTVSYYANYILPTFHATNVNIVSAYGEFISPILIGTGTGSISLAYNIYIGTGSNSGVNVSNAYGLYVTQPAYGTTKMATYTDNLSIGYPNTNPPTNGAIISGGLGIGTGSVPANIFVSIVPTITTSSSLGIGFLISAGFYNASVNSDVIDNVRINTGTLVSGTYTNLIYTALKIINQGIITGTGTVLNTYGIYIDANAVTSTNSYGLYVTAPSVGTNKYTAYFDGPVSINSTLSPTALPALSISPSSNSIYGLALIGTITGANPSGPYDTSLLIQMTLAPTSVTNNIYSTRNLPTFISPSATTITGAYVYYLNPTLNTNIGTISNVYGCYIDTGTTHTGTVTTGYSLYLNMPAYGTNKFGLRVTGSATVPSGSSIISSYIDSNLGCSSGTLSTCFHQYIYPAHGVNAATTTTAYGQYIDGGTTAGTITTGISSYVNMPAYGVSKHGLWMSGSATIASGNTLIGLNIGPSLGCSSGTLSGCYISYIYPNFSANSATLTNAYGHFIDVGSGAGTITNGYGLYVQTPAYGTNKYCAVFAGTIYPSVDATYNVGSASLRFVNIYATSGTVNSSDRNMKDDIQPETLGLDFISQLKPVTYKWKDETSYHLNDNGNEKPVDKTHVRYHHGLIAQDIKEILDNNNISADNAAFWIDSSINEPDKPATYGLIYTEFISILIKSVQELNEKNKNLEKDNQEMKLQINNLQDSFNEILLSIKK